MQEKQRLQFLEANKLTLIYTTLLIDLNEKNREILDDLSINQLAELEHIHEFTFKEFRKTFNKEFEKYIESVKKEK